MDIQPSPTKKTDEKVALLTAGQGEHPQSSRFSRRRFIQTGIAVSPLLMSVKSPASWGSGTNITNTSVAGQISGNTSTTGGSTCIPKKPIDWCDIFDGKFPGSGHWWDKLKDWGYVDHQSILDALGICGVHSHTPFLGLFCNELSSWISCKTQSYWKYKIITGSCDDPTIHGALQFSSFNILLRVQHNNSMISSGGYYGQQNNHFGSFGYDITSRDNNKCFDVNISDTNLHKYLTCGYLNGLLAPNVINYQYTQTDIVNGFMAAISHMAEDIARDGSNYQPWSNSPLSILKSNLSRTWQNHYS